MKFQPFIFSAAMLFASSALAGPPVSSLKIECNWGTLTMESVLYLEDFEQGKHSADPSGDGHGPGTADEPRAGLANVVEKGNLQATCDLIEALLE
ncbi:MAG: hypothetical protein HWE39_08400 [Oceanospirillaceae bacterium]|nr:hypothetical protein [Oceanospirillaceae bacterium]